MSNEQIVKLGELSSCFIVTPDGDFVYMKPDGKMFRLRAEENPPNDALPVTVQTAVHLLRTRN